MRKRLSSLASKKSRISRLKIYPTMFGLAMFCTFSYAVNETSIQNAQEMRKSLLQQRYNSNTDSNQTHTYQQNTQSQANTAKINTQSQNTQNVAKLKSGWMLGVSLISMSPISYSCEDSLGNVCSNTFLDSKNYYKRFGWGFLLGYQHFFNPYFGLRGNVGAGGVLENTYTSLYMFQANLEALIDYPFGENLAYSIGLIGGIGGTYFYPTSSNSSASVSGAGAANYNIGVAFGFLHKHRIEFVAKHITLNNTPNISYPSLWLFNSSTNERKEKFTNWIFSLSYIATF